MLDPKDSTDDTPARRTRTRPAGHFMSRPRLILAAVTIAAVAAAGVALNFVLEPGSTPSNATAKMAPAIAGPTATGQRFNLAAQRGHWLLVNFFASWCVNCRQELRALASLQHLHPDGLQLVSIDGTDDSLAAAEALIRAAGGTWPLVKDPAATTAYSVTGLPESFLLNPSGHIVTHIIGGVTPTTIDHQLKRKHW
jgi:cytochrome c biogenesis protein CcmG/thiol:disulfide interchange protein DsbE